MTHVDSHCARARPRQYILIIRHARTYVQYHNNANTVLLFRRQYRNLRRREGNRNILVFYTHVFRFEKRKKNKTKRNGSRWYVVQVKVRLVCSRRHAAGHLCGVRTTHYAAFKWKPSARTSARRRNRYNFYSSPGDFIGFGFIVLRRRWRELVWTRFTTRDVPVDPLDRRAHRRRRHRPSTRHYVMATVRDLKH